MRLKYKALYNSTCFHPFMHKELLLKNRGIYYIIKFSKFATDNLAHTYVSEQLTQVWGRNSIITCTCILLLFGILVFEYIIYCQFMFTIKIMVYWEYLFFTEKENVPLEKIILPQLVTSSTGYKYFPNIILLGKILHNTGKNIVFEPTYTLYNLLCMYVPHNSFFKTYCTYMWSLHWASIS